MQIVVEQGETQQFKISLPFCFVAFGLDGVEPVLCLALVLRLGKQVYCMEE